MKPSLPWRLSFWLALSPLLVAPAFALAIWASGNFNWGLAWLSLSTFVEYIADVIHKWENDEFD